MWGESELAHLMRGHDWSKTSLGPVSTWPQSLHTAVSLILNSQHPMWIGWGPEAIFLYNDAYIQVLSRAKHPWALGRPASEVWAEIWDVCGPLADKVFQKGEATFVDDVRLFMNRGDFLEETYYSFSYSPIRDESGSVSGLFCPSADVTAKVLNARRLRTLSELSAAAFVERTVENACISATGTLAKNPDDIPFALVYILTPDSQELQLRGTAGLLGPKGTGLSPQAERLARKNEMAFAEVLYSGKAVEIAVENIADLPLGPGEQKVREALVLPVKSLADDRVIGVLIAGVNPTRKLDDDYRTFYDLVSNHVATAIANALAYQEQRKRAETLAELDRAKTIFFSNVSHEFRTPLTLMLGPLEQVLADTEGMRDDRRHLVELAQRNGGRLLKLVNTLLDFSRIEAGRVNVAFRPVDLAGFTAELASMFRSATDRAGLRLRIECDPLAQPVYVDSEMWEKIVLNLVSNAFKFTFQGEIAVRVEDGGDGANLVVSDTGVGIPESELPRIFDRFHRVQGTKGRSFEGSGIGLSLVQELVKLHGGSIAVESELNRGTAFRVWLPYGSEHLPQQQLSGHQSIGAQSGVAAPYVAEALSWVGIEPRDDEAEAVSSGAVLASDEQVQNVLLVDDNNDMREYVGRLLRRRFRVTTAQNGKEALEMARMSAPDLVLTDVMMPEMNGFELLAELRKSPATSTVPVIFLSARAGEEARLEGLQQGADDYLVKPFSARELLARVENNLALSRLRRDAEKKIRESEERFRALVSASSDVIYRMSPDWREMRQLHGRDFLPDTESPSEGWLEKYIHPDDQGRVIAAMQEAIRRKSNFELEHRVLRTDGSLGWTFSRAVPILDSNGEIIEWFGAATDITAGKQAEEALLRSEKLASVGRMAATISHEINNPLEAVTNMLYIARGVAGLPETVRQYLDIADGELKRIAHITRQSLGFYRESNAPAVTLINAVLESAADLLTNRIKAKNVVLEKQWKGTVQAKAVAGELRQVFSNLLANSLDAVGDGGVIKLRCSNVTKLDEGRCVRVTIADNGKGIDQNSRQHLFEAFFTTKGTIGTGLGLWVSKQIIDKHKGTIRVRSCTSGPRRGTVFSVLLPENILVPSEARETAAD